MVSLWRKYKSASKRKKEALHSVIAGLIFFLLIYILTRFFSLTLCPIKRFFDKDCFGCGLSRGFVAILSFDLRAATEYNVLSIPLFVGIMVYAALCFFDVFFDKNNVERLETFMMKKYMIVLYLIILALSVYFNGLM